MKFGRFYKTIKRLLGLYRETRIKAVPNLDAFETCVTELHGEIDIHNVLILTNFISIILEIVHYAF